MRPVVHRLVAHLELDGDLMNPPAAGKPKQSEPTGSKVLMRMLARQLLQGLLLRFGQFNGTFHGQAGDRDEIACQTRHSENRLLDTLNLSHNPRIVGMHVRDRRGYAERGHLIDGNFCLTVCSALSAVGRFNWRSQC
jgi:hypothetical protein